MTYLYVLLAGSTSPPEQRSSPPAQPSPDSDVALYRPSIHPPSRNGSPEDLANVIVNGNGAAMNPRFPTLSYQDNNNSVNIAKPEVESTFVTRKDFSPLSRPPKPSGGYRGKAGKIYGYGEDVQATDTPGIPERTKKQNRWAFNVWREWARKRNVTVSVYRLFCGSCQSNLI